MKRRYRMLVSVLVGAASVGLVIVLVLLATATEGPLGAILRSAGQIVRRLESGVVDRVRGPGRASRMGYIATVRESADSLRRRGRLLLGAYDAGLPDSLDGVLRLEDALGHPLGVIQVYAAWGDRAEQRFPERILRAPDLT